MSGLISTVEVDHILSGQAGEARTISCPLEGAVGRVLREPILADRDLPPFNRVMMDGYAIRYADRKAGSFSVTGQQLAGAPVTILPLKAGSAIEIMTGAVLPEGADTVIPYEDTVRKEDRFSLADSGGIESGQFVHRKGSDHVRGAALLEPGCRIGPVESGIAASCGYADVAISQLPRMAVFDTGDELVAVEEKPAPHQIRRSNACAVSAALIAAGFPCGSSGHLGDDADTESARLARAVEASDILIISGAVSKGRRDWIPAALNGLGQCLFHGVAQRPGKPMGFWRADSGCAVFALPGNPVSTIVSAHRYIVPFLRRRQGEVPSPPVRVRLGEAFSFGRSLTFFLPVKCGRDGTALPRPVNNSGDYAGLTASDGFVELPANQDNWPAGSTLEFYPWML